MALLVRVVTAGSRRLTTSMPTLGRARLHSGRVLGADYTMNDPFEHATGREKLQLTAKRQGNDDPFNMKPVTRGESTKDNPTKVPSFLEWRIVGCLCAQDAMHFKYFVLEKGKKRRCGCGHWFELVDAKPLPECPEFQAIPSHA